MCVHALQKAQNQNETMQELPKLTPTKRFGQLNLHFPINHSSINSNFFVIPRKQ